MKQLVPLKTAAKTLKIPGRKLRLKFIELGFKVYEVDGVFRLREEDIEEFLRVHEYHPDKVAARHQLARSLVGSK